MCGIGGIISVNPNRIDTAVLQRMASCMAHRGPDGEATWISDSGCAGFAHRRLKVIDLSAEADQPMHFAGRYTIVYNGELYNYIELRSQLQAQGVRFSTHSDTEVVLAAYATYGYECLQMFDGMFAIAIWDEQQQELFCARDRFGEKPLYYHFDNKAGAFTFSSEMKGIYASGKAADVDDGMLLGFLALAQTADPTAAERTFDKGIKKIKAAHYLVLKLRKDGISVAEQRYWSLTSNVQAISMEAASSRLNELLYLSIKRRLRSDVPTGISLSGGLDSSAIAATLRSITQKPLNAFTAVFPGFALDESSTAALIAHQFNLSHHQVNMSAYDLATGLERVIFHQEEPFTSASVFAQFEVFRAAASRDVTVLLDGQGADEVLAGYSKYLGWRRYALMPALIARALEMKQRLSMINNRHLDREFCRSNWREVGVKKPRINDLNDWLYFNTFTSGLDELLRYADRNAMAHGREVRLPFLFHELVEFAFSLPATVKIGDGYTKKVLRNAFRDSLPDRIILNKKKTGFEPPQQDWLQDKNVRDLLESSARTLNKEGVLSKKTDAMGLIAHEAYARNTFTWRVLIAGIWITQVKKKGSE